MPLAPERIRPVSARLDLPDLLEPPQRFKSEQDVLAYPPKLIFADARGVQDVLFGPTSIVPNLVSSFIISIGTTIVTMVLAIPAAYALARLRVPARSGRASTCSPPRCCPRWASSFPTS